MKIEVLFVNRPLSLPSINVEGCGAIARFDGIVRGTEGDRSISGLRYEAYEEMARAVIERILTDLNREHPFDLARVHHRTGFVPVGEAAILADVHSPHRAEAFAVLQKFMDRLKRDVPIWKVEAIQNS